jgi:uncharacterized protein (TIGR03066 family)
MMRALIGTGVVFVIACAAVAADEKKDDKKEAAIDTKKLIGRWEPKEPKKGEEFALEFAKDGKMVVSGTLDGKPQTLVGSYTLDGAKLSFELKAVGETIKETIVVLKLTDEELEARDKDGKTEVLTRAKPKK